MRGNFFANMKISRKLVAVFLVPSVIAMGVNIFIYVNLNVALDKINQVFSSNISLNELSDNLNRIHTGLTVGVITAIITGITRITTTSMVTGTTVVVITTADSAAAATASAAM